MSHVLTVPSADDEQNKVGELESGKWISEIVLLCPKQSPKYCPVAGT